MDKKEIVGGQAVIEGVMMLNKRKVGIAVRSPDGKIIIKKQTLKKRKSKIFKLPFVRGVIQLFMMLYIGIKALNYSANISVGEDDEEISTLEIVGMIVVSILFALLIFKLVPLLIAKYIVNKVPTIGNSNILPNIIDGVAKISIFTLYIYVISFMKDVKILFQYHGAEHKTVHCKEADLPLTIKNIKKFSRLHPRCGTAFVLIVLTLSIIVYTFVPFNISILKNFGFRILLLPVIAGIAYEILKFSSSRSESLLFKIFTRPGLWFQRLTTREPTDKQIEVAIKALEAAL